MHKKVHLEIIEQEPNESDTAGYSYIACNVEEGKTTTDISAVTCAACRHWHAVDVHSQNEFERTY
jgi:hypothetical protein